MGRFTANEADNYGGNGGSSYFALKNDGDIAKVRFMYNDMNDVEGYAVHEVEIDGKRRYVNCIRAYNEPKSACPLCASGNFQKAKMFIPLYDVDEEEVKIWERGKNFFQKISGLCSRYANGNHPLVSHIFEIERHGKKGDTQTSYETFETGCDDTRLEDLPEIPDVIGTIVMDKSFDELDYFVNEGSFPNTNGAPNRGGRESAESRRNDSGYRRNDMPTGRRTPARTDGTEAF